jgi:hypothetical protein
VIVYKFGIMSPAVLPTKAQPPPGIDANAPFSRPVSDQLLQVITRQRAQIRECGRRVEHPELTEASTLNFRCPTPHRFTAEEPRRILATKAMDHE